MRITICLIFMSIFLNSCNGQINAQREFFNKDFNWRISIPENFNEVSLSEWRKLQNDSIDTDTKLDRKSDLSKKTIFVFRNSALNFFVSTYQILNIRTDSSYLVYCKNINDFVYQTFKKQMDGIQIDSATSIEKIDNLDFHSFKFQVIYPNKMILHGIKFTRLFGNKELGVDIMYIDKDKGTLMLDSWKKSQFENQ